MTRPFIALCFISAPIALALARDEGYIYGQAVPVTCLNRTIDTGEHISDKQGNLQYIPFPTCKETNSPLAIPYGISDILTCTIDPISDQLYHLLEYYIHNDAPLACRVPTGPLVPSIGSSTISSETDGNSRGNKNGDDDGTTDNSEYAIMDGSQGPSYTPLTIALQGTLQLSHIHLWTDVNVIMHRVGADDIPDLPASIKEKSEKGKSSGYVVAGTAYSLPELGGSLHQDTNNKEGKGKPAKETREKHAALVLKDARNPWGAGHGTKVVRGEPLKFAFRVSWVTGSERLGWTRTGSSFASVDFSSSLISGKSGGTFSSLFIFIFAAMFGAIAALFYERVLARSSRGRYGAGRYWKGDGILGRPLHNSQAFSHARNGSGVIYGSSGRANGYGGFASQAENESNGGGWPSMSSGKKD